MQFEWDDEKSRSNKNKHGIDFDEAKDLWKDSNRVEIHTSYPVENRIVLARMFHELVSRDHEDGRATGQPQGVGPEAYLNGTS